ncbi:MAG: DUF5309 family protein [Lachnospiraceae bacterium]|nr:DUF5309 family protein [Lachnospiraceae bacterium]
MALNLNSGTMKTTINSGIHVRQFDPVLYRRMADNQQATFVNFLRLLGMKRAAEKMGRSKGFVAGDSLQNVDNFKFEWQDIYTGTPISKITAIGDTATTTTSITVPHGSGDTDAKMFNVNDIILDRNTDERMLVTAVNRSTGVLTVVRGLGTENQGTSGTTIAVNDKLVLVSSAFAEGSYSNVPRSYSPTQEWNYCQIFKRSVENTGTNEAIKSHGGVNKLSLQRKLEHEQFMIERSRAYFKGLRASFEDPNDTSKLIRTTAGLDYFLRNNVFTRSSFTYGNFIDFCEVVYQYGGGERILVVNDKLMSLIQKEIVNNGRIQMDVSPKSKEYGFDFRRLKAHKGSMDILIDSTMGDLYDDPTGFALDTDLIEEAILRPDVWRENVQANDLDGRKDEILGECGLKVISPDRHCKLVISG